MTNYTVNQKDMETFLICSFRYALGRQTYIVSDIAEKLIEYKDVLPEFLVKQVHDDIEKAIDVNSAGADMDIEVWKKVMLKYEC